MKPTELRPSVYACACRMEETLRRHDGAKGRHGWQGMDLSDFARMIDNECLELRRVAQGVPAVNPSKSALEAFADEVTDVANFLMMLTERIGRLDVIGAHEALKVAAATAVQPPPGMSAALWTALLNHRE